MSRIPNHIAIIMDGNGRWAAQRSLPRLAGHSAGAMAVEEAIKGCLSHGVTTLSLFGFSTENWNRPTTEVTGLMDLLRRYIHEKQATLLARDIRFMVVGHRRGLADDLQQLLAATEQKTAHCQTLTLALALNYGGQDDIIQAARTVQERQQPISRETIQAALYTHPLPDPDLLIRTSGEQRLSNFFLWQAAYSELYFTPTLWPDFTTDDLTQAITAYAGRHRRFGAL